MKKLDHFLFGNGYGTSTPYFDNVYYWLVNTIHGREAGKGQLYMWSGWFGCQLASWQWTHPVAGERRRLAGQEFVVFRSERRGPRVMVWWALTHLPKPVDATNQTLRDLQKHLNERLGSDR